MRILCVGAHPDDCEIQVGGTAAKFVALGHSVKFLSVTNGCMGHHLHQAEAMVRIRRDEGKEAARRLGIGDTEILDYADGEFLPTVKARQDVIRRIRQWEADIVMTHRPWDYHPDHRYVSQVVQDSAYLVMVPHICPETPALSHNPLFLYLEDAFQLPIPFRTDVAVDISDVFEKKVDALDAHASQFHEWLPWIEGIRTSEVDESSKRDSIVKWLARNRVRNPSTQAALARRYGGGQIDHAEGFQLCEYGRRLSDDDELDRIFPR